MEKPINPFICLLHEHNLKYFRDTQGENGTAWGDVFPKMNSTMDVWDVQTWSSSKDMTKAAIVEADNFLNKAIGR